MRSPSSPAPAPPPPAWLLDRLRQAGGAVPFATYMQWVLHDPDHGAYGSGRLSIGPRGDFATSPSLGPDFAALLAVQVADWLAALGPGPLTLIEAGPGEGDLAAQLATELAARWPDLAARTSLLLLEPNPGMAARQRARLAACPLQVQWQSDPEACPPVARGVLLAHEVLDALAVERILWDGRCWREQQVALAPDPSGGERLCLSPGEPLADGARQRLRQVAEAAADPGLLAGQRPAGWASELHPGVEPWLAAAAGLLQQGWLLVIDYALEARRYYHPSRADGTLITYGRQLAGSDPLAAPGQLDLTTHLCVESLLAAAASAGWQAAGHCRQGEALLALGLAGRLHGLQATSPETLAERLARREALLRLVDPAALGDFRWLAWRRGAGSGGGSAADLGPRFLREPQPAAADGTLGLQH